MFVDWQFTASDDEYLDPARYQYREAFVLIDAALGSRPVTFCPFIYVDNDAALARGWASFRHVRTPRRASRRHSPRLAKGQQDQPAVNELTVSITDDLKLVDLWRGEGQLSFPHAPGEELHALGPIKVGAGFRHGLSYSVTDLEIVKDFTK